MLLDKIKGFFELQAFGVCSYIGEKMRLPSSLIRLFFIYTTFIAIGSPIVALYLGLAFLLRFKKYLLGKPAQVMDV